MILLLALSSCGLLSKYDYGQHTYFKHSLTEEEKKAIENNGTIIKRWVGTNNLNDSLTGNILVRNGKPYEFIEVGDWHEKSQLTGNSKVLGTYNRELSYDQQGNLVSMTSYFKKRNSDDYWLIETMESVTDSKGLMQVYKGYYDSGELQYQYSLYVTDFGKTRSDYLRTKEVAEPIQYFDKSGQQIAHLPIAPYEGISKFTKMKQK